MSARTDALLRDSNGPVAAVRETLRRLDVQLDFAQAFLAGRSGDEVHDWTPLLGRAEARVEQGGDPVAILREVEAILAPIGEAAKGYVIHCVGHGHIDMNWMWSWPETVAVTHDTFASVLSFMDRYPNFTYSQSQASVYALVERHYPEMFERIRQRVREGRWEVAAVHWVEGDKNLASGESLARHLLLTRRYFQEKFGLSAEDLPLDWEPDTFGHANSLPGILRQGGVKYYYCCRPGGGHDHVQVGEDRPRMFWWEGPDGARVLVNRESTWYNSYVNIGDNIALPAVGFFEETGLRHWLNVYGVGNHGGGPTRAEIEWYETLASLPIYPQVIFGTARGFFDAVAPDAGHLPVIAHELNYEFSGCYTSQSAIKRANRFGENYCTEAETLALLAGLSDASPNLDEAWRNVLFNQFHDILPGSGVAATREHALGLFQETGAITGSIKRRAGEAFGRDANTASLLPDTPEGRAELELVRSGRANDPYVAGAGIGAMLGGHSQGSSGGQRFRPFLIANPLAWERTEYVTVDLYDMDLEPSRLIARDEEGRQVPVTFLSRGNDWAHDKITVTFPATVPALGYRTYLIGEGVPNVDLPTVSADRNERFSTPDLDLHFDRYTGKLNRLFDRRTGLDHPGQPAWLLVREQPRDMTSWVLGGNAHEGTPLPARWFSWKGIERNYGDGRTIGSATAFFTQSDLEVPGTNSTVTVRSRTSGLTSRLDFEAEIDWREIGDPERGIPGLMVRFNAGFSGAVAARFETPFGVVERRSDDGWTEVPTLRFATLQSADGPAVTILQDCKYGFSHRGAEIQMRVVRSSYDPDHAPEVGKGTVRYSLILHAERPSDADLVRLGAEWNHPLIVFPVDLQEGDGESVRSFGQVLTPDVVLSGLRYSEDGGIVARLVNYTDGPVDAELRLASEVLGSRERAETVDLMDRPTGHATLAGDRVTVAIPARSFVSVKLT